MNPRFRPTCRRVTRTTLVILATSLLCCHNSKASAPAEPPIQAEPGAAEREPTKPSDEPSAPAASVDPVAIPDASPTTESTEAPIGEESCDAYFASYRKCIDEELPEEERAPRMQGLAELGDKLRAVTSTPAGQDAAATACKMLSESVEEPCGTAKAKPAATGTKPATKPAKPAAKRTKPASASTRNWKKLGVPVCDEYIRKYAKCIEERYPESQRAGAREAHESSVYMWSRAAETAEGRAGLVAECEYAMSVVTDVCGW